jgi:Carboxypeptidase regulatory-like domain
MNIHSNFDPSSYARQVFRIVLLAILFVTPMRAQTVGGAMLGTISDQSGAPMDSVEVSIKNVATGLVTVVRTNAAGFYTAPTLTPGEYEVTASMQGFSTQVRSGITLTVNGSELVNLQMKIGNASEIVNVTSAAPTVDLASSTIGNVVDSKTIVDLPLNGRDWTQLATLQPGVGLLQAQVGGLGSPAAPGGKTPRGNGVQMVISGGRPQENNYRLDGINIDDYANSAPGSVLGFNLGVDAVEEFSVLTSNYSSQYGRGSGGVINAVTRNGTNTLHGDVYEFLRNSALDARNFFDVQKPEFRRNQFGASAGGPIRKDKTFFFGDYEGFRETLGSSTVDLVPSPNARNGILSTGNVAVDPAIMPYLALWPLPNGPLLAGGDVGQFSISAPEISSEDYAIGRIDHIFSSSDNLGGTYLFDNGNVSSPDEFNNKPNTLKSRRQVFSLSENHIFTPAVVNSARIGLSRTAAQHGIISTVFNPILKDPAFGFIPGHAIGLIGVQGITGFSGGLGNDDGDTYWYTSLQAYDDLYITKGIHSIKIGADVERIRLNENSPSAEEGDWEFNSLSDFLTNRPFTFKGAIPPSATYYALRQTIVGAYVLDDVRLRPNFTVNLGLRYEVATIPTEIHGHSAPLFHITDPTATVGPFFLSNPTLKNFEPRVGFAWDPFRNGKTSVRAGFGMYDILPLPYLFHQITNSAPFFQGGQVVTPQGTFPKQGFPILGPTSGQGWYTDPHPERPYKMQWNFNVQRELDPSTTLIVAFTGSRGVHLVWHNQWINTVIPTLTPQGFLFPPPGTPVLNPNFGRINALLFQGNSFYDGLQIGLTRRLSHGLQAQISYTFSKSIDDNSSSFDGEEFNNSVNNPLPFDVKANRAVSDFNIPHVFVASFLWNIPAPSSWSGISGWIARGWQLGGIFTTQSGTPFTALIAGDQAGSQMDGHSAQRPIYNAAPGCSTDAINPGNFANYIKTQCFSFPPAGLIPNTIIGRNTLTGPRETNLDFSIFKNIPVKRVSEFFQVQFRAEAFNILNHSNLQPPYNNNVIFDNGGNIVSGVGFIQGTQTTSRQIQFGLKLLF